MEKGDDFHWEINYLYFIGKNGSYQHNANISQNNTAPVVAAAVWEVLIVLLAVVFVIEVLCFSLLADHNTD